MNLIFKLFLSKFPVERIAAWLVTKLLDKIDDAKYKQNYVKADVLMQKAALTSQRLFEQAALLSDIVSDRTVTTEEADKLKDSLSEAGKEIFELWANGLSAKPLQVKMPEGKPYAENPVKN